jgi:uncharacterized protein (TIGR00725 family)
VAIQIAVVGSGVGDESVKELAKEVGREIAKAGAVLVTGGLGGVMESASSGAKEAGGTTIGIIPGTDKNDANPHVDYVVVTGMGHARNVLVVRSADVVIALPGGAGTLSEVALATKMGKKVIGLGAWGEIDGATTAGTPKEAVKIAIDSVG